MATNRYFRSNFNSRSEQDLFQKLTTESIKIHGHDMYYIPRTLVQFDRLYAEDKLSAFKEAIPLEMYFNTTEKFEGAEEILTQFGLEIRDELRVSVSKERFEEEVNLARMDVKVPRPGDLVYVPIDESVFEIMFVQDKEAFYQLGNLYSYELTMKRFEFGSETFETGIENIDKFETNFATSTDITFDSFTGTFMFGERVYQGTSLIDSTASAEVIKWNPDTMTLSLIKVRGTFTDNETVTGNDSGATGLFSDVAEDVEMNKQDYNKDNDLVIDISEELINRTEKNPTL